VAACDKSLFCKENIFFVCKYITGGSGKFFAADFLDFIFLRRRRLKLKYAFTNLFFGVE
jgi:hypothetical protein